MYFSVCKGIANSLLLISLLAFSDSAAAAEKKPTLTASVQFSAKPSQCVALHEGRTCYAQITLSWQINDNGDYCVFEKSKKRLIACWQKGLINEAKFDFESNEKVEFILIKKGETQPLAETFVDVSWVHKASPRKRRWRLF